MLKRLVVIAFFSGLGQLFSILTIKWVAQKTNASEMVYLAQIDSFFQLIINILALGLQSAAMRNIALQNDWHAEYSHTQSARMFMALLLIPAGLVSFYNPAYIIFLLAPVLALSGDYALYARGYSVEGSVVSLVRVLIPYIAVLVAGYFYKTNLTWFYFFGLVVAFGITNIYITRELKIKNLYLPAWNNFILYFKTLHLGFVNLSFYLIGLGMLLVVPYFYPAAVIPVVFIGLKLHMIFKWVLRMVHQSFLKDMISDKVCLQVDQLCSLIGLVFASMIIVFPKSFISVFIGKQHLPYTSFFIYLALAAVTYSWFSSLTTKALFEKKDSKYALVAIICSGVALLSPIVSSFFTKDPSVVSFCLFISEALFSILMVVFISNKSYIKERLIFYTKNLAFFIIPCLIRILFADNLIPFYVSIALLSISLGLSYYKRFVTVA